MSIRDEIAAGPTWSRWKPPADSLISEAASVYLHPPCVACLDGDICDQDTGLCRPCWRVWRFSRPGGRLTYEPGPLP